ncbi:MAG TPA: hypothetical protein VHX88_03105 [Solirubrobacteraceae bacterium]|jgi:hypothetical protein|nr:hypothetical protein [Solirubrobacteraceae bacterium]
MKVLRTRPLAAGLLALGVAAPAALAATHAGLRGKNAQGLAITLSAASKAGVRTVAFNARMSCSNAMKLTDDSFSDQVRPSAKGYFRVDSTTNAGATVTALHGTIKGSRASGAMRIVEYFSGIPNSSNHYPLQAHGSIRCDSGTVKWTAKKR